MQHILIFLHEYIHTYEDQLAVQYSTLHTLVCIILLHENIVQHKTSLCTTQHYSQGYRKPSVHKYRTCIMALRHVCYKPICLPVIKFKYFSSIFPLHFCFNPTSLLTTAMNDWKPHTANAAQTYIFKKDMVTL